MIVNFQINNITIQANGDDATMIKSGILAHLLTIEKIAASLNVNGKAEIRTLPKKDIQDLDYDNDKNPEDEEKKEFDPDFDSIG